MILSCLHTKVDRIWHGYNARGYSKQHEILESIHFSLLLWCEYVLILENQILHIDFSLSWSACRINFLHRLQPLMAHHLLLLDVLHYIRVGLHAILLIDVSLLLRLLHKDRWCRLCLLRTRGRHMLKLLRLHLLRLL